MSAHTCATIWIFELAIDISQCICGVCSIVLCVLSTTFIQLVYALSAVNLPVDMQYLS